jgi:mannose-1-phosphate guanylyltransferase
MKIILMAGGSGTRLWPISTTHFPKQFHTFGRKKSLLQETFTRVEALGKDNIFVITLDAFRPFVQEQLPTLSPGNILSTPIARDSALHIATCVTHFLKKNTPEEEPLLFLPSDHDVSPPSAYTQFLQHCFQIFRKKKNGLFTIGITPHTFSTQFGYIALKKKAPHQDFSHVKSFYEKPSTNKAKALLERENIVWNAGYILGSVSRIHKAFHEHAPEILKEIKKDSPNYETIPPLSFDHAIWEKEKDIYCIPTNNAFSWNDIGNWNTAGPILPPSKSSCCDKEGNIHPPKTLKNILFSSSKKPIITLGIEDCVLIESEEGILLAHKESLPHLKKTLSFLKKHENS